MRQITQPIQRSVWIMERRRLRLHLSVLHLLDGWLADSEIFSTGHFVHVHDQAERLHDEILCQLQVTSVPDPTGLNALRNVRPERLQEIGRRRNSFPAESR